MAAEDVTQDVFLQVWRDAARYDGSRGTVRVWILVIARARALDRLRTQRLQLGRAARLHDATGSGDLLSGSPEREAARGQQRAAIDAALAVLPAGDRRLIELGYGEGLSQTEIAERLQQPLGTVKTRMRRVLRLLRAAMGDRTPFSWLRRVLPERVIVPEGPVLRDVQVLAVDDEPETLKLVTFVLQRAGAYVMAAASADQAMRRLNAVWPDVLVTDLEMPLRDGYSLLQSVRERNVGAGRPLPAVAFTAHGGEADRLRILRAGFNLYLLKPVSPSLLVQSIAELTRPDEPQRRLA